jgi:hypothetical protein
VYAVDASNIIEQARAVAEANSLSERITFIQGKVEDIALPEQVDVIISEVCFCVLRFSFLLSGAVDGLLPLL